MNINVKDVSDDNGSGVKRVWAKFIPYSDNGISKDMHSVEKTYKLKNPIELVPDGKGNYIMPNINAYEDLYKSEGIRVKIYVQDYVGNKRRLAQKDFDLFTIKAKIEPYTGQAYKTKNGRTCPLLERGQAAILTIETTGEVESLDIDFGEELNSLDNKLNENGRKITKETYHVETKEFIVPHYCKEFNYKVAVTAHRKDAYSGEDKQKQVVPEFDIPKSIYDGIRTRVR